MVFLLKKLYNFFSNRKKTYRVNNNHNSPCSFSFSLGPNITTKLWNLSVRIPIIGIGNKRPGSEGLPNSKNKMDKVKEKKGVLCNYNFLLFCVHLYFLYFYNSTSHYPTAVRSAFSSKKVPGGNSELYLLT